MNLKPDRETQEAHLNIIPPRVEVPPPERWSRRRASRLSLALGAAWLASFILSPGRLDRLPPLCPWKAITGIACPFCGLTHSVSALSHGRFHDAIAWNPFGPVVYLAGLGLLALALLTWTRGRPPLEEKRLDFVLRGSVYALASLWAVWWLTNTLRVLMH